MASGKGFIERRFLVAVSGANFTVLDAAAGQPSASPASTALAAAGTQTLPLFTMAAGQEVIACKCKPTLAFTGGAVSAATVEVGITGATDIALSRFDIFSAAADTATRRNFQIGPTLRGQVVLGHNGAGALTAVTSVGDKVVALAALSPQAGFTGAGSNQLANATPLTPGIDTESIVSVANQIQQLSASDLSAMSIIVLTAQKQEACAADGTVAAGVYTPPAGTVVNALFRTTGANVNALTAGSMEIDLLIWDCPITNVGVG